MRKIILIAVGGISLGLGILGLCLPLLPTTPFILLTAYLWARSSARLHGALLKNRWAGPIISNYRIHKGVSLKNKILALALIWTSIPASGVYVARRWWQAGRDLFPWRWSILACLLIIAVLVTFHIVSLRTLKNDERM